MSSDEALLWLSQKLEAMGYRIRVDYFGFNVPSNLLRVFVPPKPFYICPAWGEITWKQTISYCREHGHEYIADALEQVLPYVAAYQAREPGNLPI